MPGLQLRPLLGQACNENRGGRIATGLGIHLEETHPKGEARVADDSNDYGKLHFSKTAAPVFLERDCLYLCSYSGTGSFHQEMGLCSFLQSGQGFGSL